MLKNYFKIAFRNLWRQKVFSGLNILGLSISMACALLLYLYIQQELSYDQHFPNADHIYRVNPIQIGNGQEKETPFASFLLAPTLKKEYSEIKAVTHLFELANLSLEYQERKFSEEDPLFVNASFFQVFQIPFLAGNPEDALKNPNSIVLTESSAVKIFGSAQQAVDKVLVLDNKFDTKVTAVIRDLPETTHFDFDFLVSMDTWKADWFESNKSTWRGAGFRTYLLLNPQTNPASLESKMKSLYEKYMKTELASFGIMDVNFHLQALTDIYLYSELEGELKSGISLSYVYIFSSIAFLILLIASINYINLTTARSLNRAKEVGVRKVVGSHRNQLIRQFMIESLLICIISLGISLILAELFLPIFNNLSGKNLTIPYFSNPILWLIISGIFISVALLSGLYPAFVLSGFKPVTVLKGNFTRDRKGVRLRKILVIFQFTLTIVMIIATLVVYRQMQFVENKELGFNKEQVVALDYFSLYQKWDTFQERLLTNPQISTVSKASLILGSSRQFDMPIDIEKNGQMVKENFALLSTDANFLEMMETTLVSGRYFNDDYQTERTKSVLINEATVKYMGWQVGSENPELNPIGKKIHYDYQMEGVEDLRAKVVGVVKDFHVSSLYNSIQPLIINLNKGYAWRTFVKINSNNPEEALTFIKKTWEEINPSDGFYYRFLDEEYSKQYEADKKRGQIFLVAAVLAILIASLGLFGLTAYTVSIKTKEIGIRKVLGASVGHILQLISKEFFILIAISSLIAIPIAIYLTSQWLEDFAYQISITGNWFLFVFAILVALFISLLTISIHAMRATRINPVWVLKDE